MSKEGKIRKESKKERLARQQAEDLAILKEKLGIDESVQPLVLPKQKASWSIPKIALACASLLIVIGVSIWAGIYLPPLLQSEKPPVTEDPSQDDPPTSRYCKQTEYTANDVSISLKDYSLQNGGNILYFDEYQIFEERFDTTYTLNETGEIIAFKEEFFNIETGYFIVLYTTDNYTEIETLDSYKDKCESKTTVENIKVQYTFYKDSYTIFEYNGYRYYMKVTGPSTEAELFALVAELIPD